jgi:hypothetical protein
LTEECPSIFETVLILAPLPRAMLAKVWRRSCPLLELQLVVETQSLDRLGDLEAEEVEGMRTGSIPNPTVDKVAALAGVFGVHPSYFLDESGKMPIIDREALDIFRDETTSIIARKSFHLPKWEKEMILNIVEQFENSRVAADRGAAN